MSADSKARFHDDAWSGCVIRCGSVFAVLLCLNLQAQPQRQPVEIQSETSRTAVWVGEAFEYRVRLKYQPGIEVILDNLKKENFNLDPFTLLDVRTSSGRLEEGSQLLELVLVLATHAPGNEARIPSFNIYYATRRRGPLGKGTEVDTHTLVIPEKTVGLRSTLTSASRDIRDSAQTVGAGVPAGLVLIPGWILLGLAAVEAGRWSLAAYRRRRTTKRRRDGKAIEAEALRALSAVSAPGTSDGVAERCHRISQLLRGAVKEVLDIDAASLTPEEIHAEMTKRQIQDPVASKLATILEECEVASYAPDPSTNGRRDLQLIVNDSRDVISRLAKL